MQIIRTCFFIAACLCLSQQSAFAEDDVDATTVPATQEVDSSALQPGYSAAELNDESSSPTATDILSEFIIRPTAVLGSATGFVMFVAASPFSGLASIPEPHDAFMTTWNDFVVTPYHFAFRRPFGDYSVELN